MSAIKAVGARRVYNMALDEFFAWYDAEPRGGFTKATASAWRVSLEERKLGSSSIIVRMSAIRKLAVEAMDNGLFAPELAAGIQHVKVEAATTARVPIYDLQSIVTFASTPRLYRAGPMPGKAARSIHGRAPGDSDQGRRCDPGVQAFRDSLR